MPAYADGLGRAVPSPDAPLDDPGRTGARHDDGEGAGCAARDGVGPPPGRDRIADGSGRAAPGARASGFARARNALRTRGAAPEIVCAPTPELDDVVASMRQHLDGDAKTEQSYLGSDVGPDAVGAFFRAAAALYRAKPWKAVPDDTSILSLTIEKLGIRDAVVSVIGQMGESHGVIVFRSLDDFDAFLDAADAVERGQTPAMPPHFSLNFERGADMTVALRKEIALHRWEVAGPEAYPWLVAVDEDVVARPPTSNEVTLGEALALALARVVGEGAALAAAFAGGEPMIRMLSARTHAGEIEVALRAPYEGMARAHGSIPIRLARSTLRVGSRRGRF